MSSALYKRAALIGVLVAQRGGWWAAVKAAATIIRSEGIQGLQLRLKKAQSDIKVYHGSPEDADYVNMLATARVNVLLSDQHVRLLNALRGKSSPAGDQATLGLSLATHNSAGRLPCFFESLLTQSFPLSRLNVAVVDCGSTDETRTVLENHLRDHGTRYASFTIYNRVDPELQQGHDQAIRQLSDPFVLVSNASLELHTGTIERALQAAIADSEDVAVWELQQYPVENPKYYDPVTLEALWNSHACVLMRRAAYLQVGGYDSRLQGYSEDVELSYRLRGAGWILRYLPQIPVTHHVDPIDPSLKALHWARSASANVLLRHRFAAPQVAAEGEAFLSQAHGVERALERRQALTKAQEVVDQNRTYFCQTMRPERRQVPFPFLGFDYVMSRQGASVRLPPHAPGQKFPRVTVVTRTHGPHIAMLREAITSILNQTYPEIEHLVIEDRTNFAGDLVDEVARVYGANIRYLKSDGPGRAAAGNVGLANATGELVMFLDNDDLVFPDHVELLVRTLEMHPSLVGSYALSWEVHTRTNGQGHYREVMHVLPGSQWLDFDRRRLAKANYIPIQSMLFRRSLFECAGGFRDDLDHLEDWNLWWRYAQHGNFMLVRKVTSLYRTPAEPEIRARRQAELDKAYDRVRLLNSLIETQH
ncbi:glycosyltransferase [Paracoccus sanguinis]|uniref:glycosyltransferase n=1 Tax=Paracoccus sanguinis TaxID=1545044 RepID=UPI0018CFB424|nr:glycosyltransferase [Paracoccus sanguinis]